MNLDPAARPGLTRFAARGHHRLAYEVVPADDPAAPTVVLLHALLAGRADLAVLRADLAGLYRLLLPDARGHGASAALADRRYTVADMSAELGAVLDAEGVAAAHLVGHELGGTAAFALARAHPGRVRSLALVEPALGAVLAADPDLVAAAAYREAQRVDQATGEAAYKGLTDRALDLHLDRRWGADWRDRLPRPRLAAARRHAGALAGTLAALDGLAVSGDDLAAVGVPALVVHTVGADPTTRLVCARLAAALPAARLATIPAPSPGDPPLAGEPGVALAALLHPFLAAATAGSP